jgi:hypothetical protein
MPRSREPVTAEQHDTAVAGLAGRVDRVLLVGGDDGWALLRRAWPELASALEALADKVTVPVKRAYRTWERDGAAADRVTDALPGGDKMSRVEHSGEGGGADVCSRRISEDQAGSRRGNAGHDRGANR